MGVNKVESYTRRNAKQRFKQGQKSWPKEDNAHCPILSFLPNLDDSSTKAFLDKIKSNSIGRF